MLEGHGDQFWIMGIAPQNTAHDVHGRATGALGDLTATPSSKASHYDVGTLDHNHFWAHRSVVLALVRTRTSSQVDGYCGGRAGGDPVDQETAITSVSNSRVLHGDLSLCSSGCDVLEPPLGKSAAW